MKRVALLGTLLLVFVLTAATASAGIILPPGWPFLPPIITPPVIGAPSPAYYPDSYDYYSYPYPYGYYSYPYGYYGYRGWGPGYWGYGRDGVIMVLEVRVIGVMVDGVIMVLEVRVIGVMVDGVIMVLEVRVMGVMVKEVVLEVRVPGSGGLAITPFSVNCTVVFERKRKEGFS